MDVQIATWSLQRVLEGVVTAAQAPGDLHESLLDWILLQDDDSPDGGTPVLKLLDNFMAEQDLDDTDAIRLFKTTLAVSILCQASHSGRLLSASDLDYVWQLIREAFVQGATNEAGRSELMYKVSRGAPGYLSIPLFSLVAGGKLDQLIRIHIWLPDGERSSPEVAGIHAHQTFAQSWILAGRMTNHRYTAEEVDDESAATHAEYAPRWNDGKYAGNSYKIGQVSSTARKTKRLYKVTPVESTIHTRNTTYTTPAGGYHWPSTAGDKFCATLFYFDSQDFNSFKQDAPVMGSVTHSESVQKRDPGSNTAAGLIELVSNVRSREMQGETVRQEVEDDIILAYHRLISGRAELNRPLEIADIGWEGHVRNEAFAILNGAGDKCPPIVALCKAPTQLHRQYLQELLDFGPDVDIDATDEAGYKALDYAVLNDDSSAEASLVDGYRQRYDSTIVGNVIERSKEESRIRKAYHSLLNDRIRPILQNAPEDTLQQMRYAYADARVNDPERERSFDGLRYLWYSDFIDSPRLPRYMDGRVRTFSPDANFPDNAEYVIFISYRWIHKDPVTGKTAPDDKDHTQFLRMVRALNLFLQRHPSINKDKLGIWMDSVCIDRRAPEPGIWALPMNIAQCNALITITDETYWQRAWCSMEALMFQILRESYPYYEWFEYLPVQSDTSEVEGWELREAPAEVDIDMSRKTMTWEQDRPKIAFLERQARLLAAARPTSDRIESAVQRLQIVEQ